MKTILIFSALTFLLTGTYAQSFPVDKNTGKVSYSGEVSLTGKSKNQIFEQLINWITDYTAFRGNFNAIYADHENGVIKAGISLDLNQTFKTTLWFANCSFSLNISEDACNYRITNFYTYMCLSLYRSMLMNDTPFGMELEKNTQFKISEISANECTKTLDTQINQLIEALKQGLMSEN